MPRLLLLRHAKSAWKNDGIEDFDRPLAARGRTDAPLVGAHLAEHGLTPQKILCSSARRCRETLHALLPHFVDDLDIRVTRELYLADEDRTIDQIRAHGALARTLMVIAHNPGLEEAAVALAGSASPLFLEDLETKFPTAGLAVIDFPAVKWVDIEPKSGRLVAFLRPRTLHLAREPYDILDE
ncbi:histidine phosphatase family protein [Siculibacillus lacustris]|uniref:Histidine phosphatase family protein n=1 Tax=Siculibacillus lacustris TaxID=1549641 RepID=A0A4Q9VH31_9HYPH|nr:histidine phosphatase family protein [Siculibacillus lacustris]TBW33511.1 histidine phosphatase family protein [Siculibacillus lacustris]